MKTSEVLRKAADLMEELGQAKGNLSGPNGEVCALAAIARAPTGAWTPLGSGSSEVREALTAFVVGIGGGGICGICDFNNSHTQEEVVAKLREVADQVEQTDKTLVPA